jgi:hypothetical protein
MKEIEALRKIDFSVVTQRTQALERFNNMRAVHTFAQDTRFPADGYFVCEIVGDWARKFQQIKTALSHRDNTDLKSHKTEGAPDKQSFSDAQQAFWNATTNMYDQLIRADGLFDRVLFETQYQWQ